MGLGELTFGWRRASLTAALALAILLIVFVVTAGRAGAEIAPAVLWTKCQNGSGAGQCSIPRGIGVDATSGTARGHLYVADQANDRIVEFTAWGEFVKAWGWDVVESGPGDDTVAPEDELEVCVPADGDVCKAGVKGGDRGQLVRPQGVTVDTSGDIYVAEGDFSNRRVQKFSPEGGFIWMAGGNVNKTKVEAAAPEAERNLCPIAPGDVCQAATQGAGNGQFGAWVPGSFIGLDAASPQTLYVGDQNRIQEFDTDGHYLGNFPDPEGLLAGKTVKSLAVRPAGGVSVVLEGVADVFSLAATNKACTATASNPEAVASDAAGNLYVVNKAAKTKAEVRKFSAACVPIPYEPGPGFGSDALEDATGLATSSACFSEGLGIYVGNSFQANSFVRAYGPLPDPALCAPPREAPEITAQYATSVGVSEAVLGADIDAQFFTAAAGTTRYYVQYGTEECVKGGGWGAACVELTPAPPGTKLKGGPSTEPLRSGGVFLSGLQPDTAYLYRFAVESRDGEGEPVVPGQPVIGEGGKVGVEGNAGSFMTFPSPEAAPPCANDAFRTGPGAALPDCRAYEMVSPVDKEGGDIVARGEVSTDEYPARLDQSAVGGGAFTYSSYRSFDGAASAPYSTQYLARRGAGGWESEPISPPKEGDLFSAGGGLLSALLQSPFKAFTADLSRGWVATYSEPVLAPGGQPGFSNLYRRRSSDGGYEACTTSAPQVEEPEKIDLLLQGISADGSAGIFRARDALTPDANPPAAAGGFTNAQLYECREGEVRLVSILPDGSASELENNVGTRTKRASDFHSTTVQNAVSADGGRVFWTAGDETGGKIYVRVGGEETLAVSEAGEALSGTSASRYWTAARDGSKAVFTSGGDLYVFDVDSGTTTPIASQVLGVAGASADAGRIYFASRADLGGGASAGKPNLYLYEAGEEGGEPSYAFVGPLAERDALADHPTRSPIQAAPTRHTARVSPDGAHLAFMAESPELAELAAGYDNTDVASGHSDREVYRYEAGSGDLACLSCNRSGARPTGRAVPHEDGVGNWKAAGFPDPDTSLYAQHLLSEDGSRVFFESFGPLVLTDTNGKADVYEWEEAGAGGCKEADAAFVEASGGCVYLISSGKSPADSELADAGADGSDVFIRTAASLVGQDPGSVDLYDARIGGGFPPPPPPHPACAESSCQSPAGAPEDPTPASASFQGPGDPGAAKPKPRRCRRRATKKGTAAKRCAKGRGRQSSRGRRAGR